MFVDSDDMYNRNGQGAPRLGIALLICALASVACVPRARQLPDALNEISGLVAFGDSVGVAIVDGGNPGLLYRYDFARRRLTSFGDSLPNEDREAISYDPGAGKFYVCDVGDNRRVRESVSVYELSEEGRLTDAFTFTYPDGAHDCEACLVRGDTVILITKARTLGGDRHRQANVYRGRLESTSASALTLVDSFTLKRRSVTDAVRLPDGRMAVLAYDYRLVGPLPFCRTTLLVGTLDGFRQNRSRRYRIRAPFITTQFESVALAARPNVLWLASERTLWWPARWRRVELGNHHTSP